jgi:flagellar basal-body rod protein FlgB
MSFLDTTQLALDAAMQGSMMRQTLLTNNLANTETPGYKPQDVNFQATLDSAIRQGTPLDQVSFSPYTEMQTVSADGNGVSPEMQSSALSENGLLFEGLSDIATQRERIMLAAMGAPGS